MQLKKEILLFYMLILICAGVIIAAEKPQGKEGVKNGKEDAKKPATKCCKISRPSAAPLNTITEGILRGRA